MSSHHIIREDQEPALLIMDPEVSYERVQELLEWSPTVIVSDAVLTEVLRWGIKIDVVVVGADRVQELTTALQDQFPLKLLSYHESEEALSTALYFLLAKKQKAVTIISREPLENFEPFSLLDISVFHADKRWVYIRNGSYEKWLPAGRNLHVYPANDQHEIQTTRDGLVKINRDKGFWVSEI